MPRVHACLPFPLGRKQQEPAMGRLLYYKKTKKALVSGLGLEPRTNALKGRCSTN
jgi:hypothetical protein